MDERPSARLLIADDNERVRSNLVRIFEGAANLDVVGEASDGHEAVEVCGEARPDLVLMDVRMPRMDGIEATREIKLRYSGVSVLILTAFEDPEYLLSALDAGAAGYILKHAEPDDIVRAARAALSGGHPLDAELSSAVVRDVAREGRGAVPAPEAIRIWMLGGFEMSVGSRTIEGSEWRGRKAGSLVKLLALSENRRLHREHAASLLWPDLDATSQSGSLRRALHSARRALGPSNPGHLAIRRDILSLCPDATAWTDVEAFEEAAKTARTARDTSAYRAAVELYAGELLPEDRYEEWAEERRGELRALRLSLLVELAALHEEKKEYDPAVEALERVVSEESSHEEAHLALMRVFALRGERGRAVSQFSKLERALGGLASKPSEASRRIYEQISEGTFPKKPPESRASEARREARHNLPHSRASFVGREREMVEVKRSLAMTRLLTLTGAGGCGKTRLAVEVAHSLTGAYPDGVWMAKLAPVSDPALVPRTVAGALGVREQPGRPLTRTLSEYMRTRSMLLVLDNCEHLIDAVAWFADALLGSCENLRILATSREALGVSGEVAWKVSTLTVPEEGEPFENLIRYEAVRLFIERSRSKLPTFDVTEGNARSVAEVCRRLDGIPLAIELAAARMAVLAVEQVAEKLNGSLDLLALGNRTAEARHKTMRATMKWSHDLLGEPERKLFRRLSVFAGGWTLEAAEEVGGDEADSSVLDLLESLVDKSLVAAEASAEDGIRYRMLEPVRQYAREKLEESGESDGVRDLHARHYVALAEEESSEEAKFEVRESRTTAWLERMDAEQANIRAALSWSLDEGGGSGERARPGSRLAVALFWFWQTRDFHAEGRGWMEKAASRAGDPADIALKARALTGAGWMAHLARDFEGSKAFRGEALALYRELGDEEGIASGLMNVAYGALLGERDDVPLATVVEEMMELGHHIKNRTTISYELILEGIMAGVRGDLARFAALHEESLEISREIGNAQLENTCVTHLGIAAVIEADYEKASSLLGESLHQAWEIGYMMAVTISIHCLACVAASTGDPARAARLWGAVEGVGETHDTHVTSITLTHTNYEGRLETTRSHLGDEAFAAAWAAGKAMPLRQAVEYALGDEATPPRETPPATPPAADDLTRREREVAALVGSGLSNREVSAELRISERTVEGHVSKILKKLGLASRTQLAAHIVRREPL